MVLVLRRLLSCRRSSFARHVLLLPGVYHMSSVAQNIRVAPRQVEKYLAQAAIVFAAYLVAGRLGQATTNIRSGNLGPVWPAYGVAVAAILLCGYRVWGGIIVAAFLVALFSPVPPVTALGQAAGATFAALVGASLLRRIAKFRSSLSRLRDALALIVLGALVSAMVSATIGVSVLYASHVQPYAGLGSAWLIYWLGDSTGVLLITPLVLTAPDLLRIRPRARIGEFAGLLLLLTVTCFVIFADLPLVPVKLHVLAFAVLPFVMWAAIRFGVSGAAFSILLVATIATVDTALGSGPFSLNTPFTNAVLLDVFFAVLSVSGLTLAAAIAEREQGERERKQLVRRQAGMEARVRLATIVESTDDAIMGEDIDGIVTDWNKGAEQLYGYAASEVIGKATSFLIPAGETDDFREIMKRVKRGEAVSHHETVRQKKNGARLEVSLTVSPIIDSRGRMIGASSIARDITERRQAEAELRKSEERFRLAAQAGNMFAYAWDAATDELVRSAESVRILGIDAATPTTGQQTLSRVHPDDRERLLAAVAELTPENPNLQITYRIIRPDGNKIWVERQSRAHFDEHGKILKIIGMVADITERKRTEEALRESEERLILAVQAGRMYTFEWDAVTDVIIRSIESTNILKWSSDPTRDTNRQFIASVHPDDREAYTATEAGLIPEKPTYQITYRVSRPDGVVIWLEDTGRAFFDTQGRKIRVVGMVADVTDRKVAEEALESVSRRLIEAQEQERTRIARELHDDFSQRLALLAVELEELHQNPPILSEIRRRMGGLHKQVSQVATDIQTLSHELHSSKLEYLGIAAAMRGFCKEFSEQQDVEIDLRSHDLPSSLSPDVSLCLFRVLQEALHNSAKHSGVRHFEVRLWGASSEIHLTVSDAGAGFDSEAAKESRGIGLISMTERVKLLKGTFSIESEPQRGTTVHARVPISSDSKPMRATG
jgi:PAS domain S-box-containing protein